MSVAAPPSQSASPNAPESPPPTPRTLVERTREFIASFTVLSAAPRVFWICNLVNMFDGAAYFGVLNIIQLFLGKTLHFGDVEKGWAVMSLSAVLTLSGALFGSLSDRLGVRRTLTMTILVAVCGRGLLGLTPYLDHAPVLFGRNPAEVGAWLGLALIGFSGGVIQPALYAGVKQSTTKETATIGFSLLYALMNGGSLAIGYLSPLVRDRARDWKLPGGELLDYAAVVWLCGGVTILYLAIHLFGFPRREGDPVPVVVDEKAKKEKVNLRDHALLDPRFLFFIFILLGVRTLFAHQFLTIPDYIDRAYPPGVGKRLEWIETLNPLVILIGTPLLAAATRRVHVVTMMIAGTLVSAAATFLLVPGPNLTALIAYEVLFSVGEALWSSRFLEYVADVAPANKVGLFMGVAQVPWFVAKLLTGSYSGFLMRHFCPETGPRDTSTMWMINGLIGLSSPIGLFLASKWLKRGMRA